MKLRQGPAIPVRLRNPIYRYGWGAETGRYGNTDTRPDHQREHDRYSLRPIIAQKVWTGQGANNSVR